MARVYLETSFVSACVTDRKDTGSVYRREKSLEWWGLQAFGRITMRTRNNRAKRDPLIDEVRSVRKSLHDQFGGDVAKQAEYANEVARQYRSKRRVTNR